jgi:hypothetical protein
MTQPATIPIDGPPHVLPAASDEDEGVMFADDGFWVKVDPAGR